MAITTTTVLSNNVQTVLNKAIDFAFTGNVVFAKNLIANGKQHENGRDAQPGNPVYFTIYNALDPATATLSETTSGTASSIKNAQKSVTLLEKGNFITVTEKLKVTSFDDLDMTIPELVGRNAAISTDIYAFTVADSQVGANYVTYVGQTAKASITTANTLTAAVVRATRAKLQGKDVPRVKSENGAYYLWFAHPDTIYDLMAETSTGGWIDVARYASPSEILQGEMGAFEGFRFIATTLAKVEVAAGVAAQTATTVSTAAAAAATGVTLADATGIAAGDNIKLVSASGTWEYEVTGVSGTTEGVITINKAVRLNGYPVYSYSDGAGLAEAVTAAMAVAEGVTVYTNYAVGDQAFGYAYAVQPEIRVSDDPSDAYGRLSRVAWYANHAFGELRPESLHKVYCASSIGKNS